MLDQKSIDVGIQDVQLEVSLSLEDLPDEIVIHILLFVPDEHLGIYAKVCKKWLDIIQSQTLWRLKCLRSGRFVEATMAPYFPQDWREFYHKAPYTRNLIRNCSGQGEYEQQCPQNIGRQRRV